MNKENPIVQQITIEEIDEHTPSGLYVVEGFGYQFIEQLHYTVGNEPVHRTNLRSVINVQVLKDLMQRDKTAESERDYYMNRAVELRSEINAGHDINGLPTQNGRHHRGGKGHD